MKFFISHSSKDSEIAKNFSMFLSNLSMDVEVFCTSLSGMIGQGENFVEIIQRELEDSDAFIPLISKNYLNSKYCMIELGFAYSRCVNQKDKYSIFPFCVYPITKSQALLDTPLSYLQTEPINDKAELRNFVNVLLKKNILSEVQITNEMIHSFVNKVNNIIMKTDNILSNAVILPTCSDGSNPDAIQHTLNGEKHIVNFNLNANKKNIRPEFISMVLKFPGTINFYDFLSSNANISLLCSIINYTESLTNIDIEFKYHETHQPLKTYKFKLYPGINNISIPIKEMNIEGLKQISEICFVAWERYIVEEEGMFIVENIQVR